jgi:tRNA threonylcarbamoyl adenosine modification protein YjeE
MTDQPRHSFSLTLADERATAHLMADLALLVGRGDVITLSGDLGAGKTAAARAMIRHLARDATLEVPSPTFTLAQSYDLASLPVLHADLYRVGDTGELDELGLAPFPDDVLVLLEWPERAGDALPADRIDIQLSSQSALGPSSRFCVVTGFGAAAAKVQRLEKLRQFLSAAGYIDAERRYMTGDASTRSYARLVRAGTSEILMNYPARVDRQLIYDGKSYLEAVHLADEIKPFVAIGHALHARGLSAPAIHHVNLEDGFLISEDLGDEGVIEGDPPRPIVERYEAATDVLVALHRQALPATLPVAGSSPYAIPAFDVAAMLIEVSLLLDWYLPDRGVAVTPTMRDEFFALWRAILTPVLETPETWVIRDFHSPNLIWRAERRGIAKVGLIDFQDAVLGPAAYDVASLAQDARLDIAEQVEIALLSRYVQGRRGHDPKFDAARFAATYAVMSAQRNTRLLGVFSRLNRRDGKPHYLRHQPRIFTYLSRSLAHPAMESARAWYAAHLPKPAA